LSFCFKEQKRVFEYYQEFIVSEEAGWGKDPEDLFALF